ALYLGGWGNETYARFRPGPAFESAGPSGGGRVAGFGQLGTDLYALRGSNFLGSMTPSVCDAGPPQFQNLTSLDGYHSPVALESFGGKLYVGTVGNGCSRPSVCGDLDCTYGGGALHRLEDGALTLVHVWPREGGYEGVTTLASTPQALYLGMGARDS